MLFHRDPGQACVIVRGRRCANFCQGDWAGLLEDAARAAAPAACRNAAADDDAERAARAVRLSRALTAEPLAPRPTKPLRSFVAGSGPRSPGPAQPSRPRSRSPAHLSKITMEHICLLLDDPAEWVLLHQAVTRLLNSDVPQLVLDAVRIGRIVAFRTCNGRVRGLVVGDALFRLVARSLICPKPSTARTGNHCGELLRSPRCRLVVVVVALELGRHWSHEAATCDSLHATKKASRPGLPFNLHRCLGRPLVRPACLCCGSRPHVQPPGLPASQCSKR